MSTGRLKRITMIEPAVTTSGSTSSVSLNFDSDRSASARTAGKASLEHPRTALWTRSSGAWRCPSASIARIRVLRSWLEAAAISGSVGPVPNEGQSLANTQTPHAGLRAWHTRRPWKITR